MIEHDQDPENLKSLYETAPVPASAENLLTLEAIEVRDHIDNALYEITTAVVTYTKERTPFELVEKLTMAHLRRLYFLGKTRGRAEMVFDQRDPDDPEMIEG